MKGELHTVVARPVEEVFDFLADIRNETRWNPRVIRIDQTSSGPIGVGATFEGRYQGLGTLQTHLVEYERPTRLSFRSTGPRMGISGTFILAPIGTGTSIALRANLEPRGVFKLLAPLMGPVIQRQNRAAAFRLKQALEARSGNVGRGAGDT
jgi:uncharacterized protein YndB with AHSA1/START domain